MMVKTDPKKHSAFSKTELRPVGSNYTGLLSSQMCDDLDYGPRTCLTLVLIEKGLILGGKSGQ